MTLETLTAQGLGRVDPNTRALVPGIHPATTYERDADGGYSSGRAYTRPHNPTYDEVEELLAQLEAGRAAMVFGSGMAAATAVFQTLYPGDHVVVPRVMYWALRGWLVDFAVSAGLDVEFVDTTSTAELQAAMRPGKTRLLWLETPANPTWEVTNIRAAIEIARSVGARVAVDSTVATPVLCKPIELGADLVVHSATKYLNGHSDVLAGVVVTAHEDSSWQRLRTWRRDGGAVLGPFEAWLLLRGMRTLFLRVQRASATALRIARHFETHASVSVLYPGLESHPQHAIAAEQMSGGFGGMLSMRHRRGEAAAMATAARVQVFKRATSLGGVESLIEHRASIEGPSTPVPADLLRLSIGLEDPEDLIADLEHALDHEVGDDTHTLCEPYPASHTRTDDPVATIESLLATKVHILVADRGCELTLGRFADGIAELEVHGSPGACLPLRDNIERLLKHYVPAVSRVVLGAGMPQAGADDTDVADTVQRLLRDHINPAVREHGGVVELVDADAQVVNVRLGGRCQGCAMANVTFRQGVETMIMAAVPEIRAVVDVTDHSAGTNPYFKTRKQ